MFAIDYRSYRDLVLGMVVYLVFLLIVLCASWVLTGVIRRYAIAKSLIDIPNNRSSHSVPVPRGGGLSVVAVVVLTLLGLWVSGNIGASLMIALLGSSTIVALIGFIDDHGHIAARWRLLAHFFGAAWVLYWLDGLPPLFVIGIELDLGLLGYGLAAVYLVWLLNLYNFMDGIDGIASIETISVCSCAAVITVLVLPAAMGFVLLLLFVIAATIGFLFWNFPKARIFMGDACSGFLGLLLGALSIQAAWLKPELFWCWLILLGVFIVDATVTLVRRVIRGDKFYQAHCSHAYQFASREYRSHVKISSTVGVINVVWLFPIALIVGLGWVDGIVGLLIAYLPLTMLAFRFNAGVEIIPDK